MKTKYAILVVILLTVFACSGEKKEEKADSIEQENTSKADSVVDARRSRSELAVMMRNIYIDMHDNKELLASGTMPDIDWGKYTHIKEAEPTDAEDSGPAFEAFADAYVNQLKAFNNSNDSNRIETYNNLVNGCLSCHQQYCIGPMDIIKTLKIEQ